MLGFAFLCQYFYAIFLYTTSYDEFLRSPLTWSVALTGWIQAVSASLTFRFLPKKKEAG